jgi:hypothetical protein
MERTNACISVRKALSSAVNMDSMDIKASLDLRSLLEGSSS